MSQCTRSITRAIYRFTPSEGKINCWPMEFVPIPLLLPHIPFLLSILFFCKAQTIVATKFMQLMCFYGGRMCCSAVCVCVHMWTSFDWNITTRNEFFYLLALEHIFRTEKKCTIFLFFSVRSNAILNNKFHFHSMSGYCKI